MMTAREIRRLQQLARDLPPEPAGIVLDAATQHLEELIEQRQLVITAARLGLADVQRMATGGDTVVDPAAIAQQYVVRMSELEGCTTREFVSDRTARPGSDPLFSELAFAGWGLDL